MSDESKAGLLFQSLVTDLVETKVTARYAIVWTDETQAAIEDRLRASREAGVRDGIERAARKVSPSPTCFFCQDENEPCAPCMERARMAGELRALASEPAAAPAGEGEKE